VSALPTVTTVARYRRRTLQWFRTIRVRMALTYSSLLFGITALILGAIYLALQRSLSAAPLDPVTVKKFYDAEDGTLVYRPGETFQFADIADVQRAVNYTTLQMLQGYSIAALAVMFALSLLIGWWVAGRALRPVNALTKAAQQITATDLSQRINSTGPQDELRTLADTFDGMLARLERSFLAERMLVEDISHELRNPVAVVQANVEAVLGNNDATPAERTAATHVVLRATRRMTRLLEDLLATARARSESFAETDVDLAGVITESVREYAALATQRSITIAERVSPGPVVYAERDSLARAIGNLLSNAVRLAPMHSTITVGLGSRAGWAWVAVRDEGPGISDSARDRVFDRFYQAAESGSEGNGRSGSGLGLTIARQIVESHEGRLRLVSHDVAGTTFVIWLPERAIDGAPGRDEEPPTGDPLSAAAGLAVAAGLAAGAVPPVPVG
jgi:signal transduction histidine kinase